jgi:N-acetylmuramate 1-kinase
LTVSNPSDLRQAARDRFIKDAGWADADVRPFPGDASTRRYFRLRRGGETAVLMDAPARAEAPACPPGASAQERAGLGYNALARLAGNNVAAFAGLADALHARGFSAPAILHADMGQGLLLIEDLGDALFSATIAGGAHEGPLYAHAIDVLAALHRSSFTADFVYGGEAWRVMDYDAPALTAEAGLMTGWYAPHRGAEVSADFRADWDGAWAGALAMLEDQPRSLVLRDYHADNLIWLPERADEARVGLLDFQDALFGHPAYDLVSLIEDARRDVSPHLAGPLKDRFFERSGLTDRAGFEAAYAILGAQRNAKILGIFVRLARRDGKPRYLDLLARVEAHFARDLAHPALKDVKALVSRFAPDLAS